MTGDFITIAVPAAAADGGSVGPALVAMISGGIALITALLTSLITPSVSQWVARKHQVSRYREPLARAAYDLQSRLYNLLEKNFGASFIASAKSRERIYGVENTAFLISQYLCWAELTRREVQFIDLGKSAKTRQLHHCLDEIVRLWGTTDHPKVMRLFAGEQRALGEALIVERPGGPGCMGYGAFLEGPLPMGSLVIIDGLRDDIRDLPNSLQQASDRLQQLQHALIDLLDLLDPQKIRFPKGSRAKL